MKAILAVDARTYAYGNGNDLIYWCRKDLQNFKRMTVQGDDPTIVMGWNTYQSLPDGALPMRMNYVVTSRHSAMEDGDNLSFVSYDWLKDNHRPHWWLIGGENLLRQAFDDGMVDEVILTEISPVEGPALPGSQYQIDVAWLRPLINGEAWENALLHQWQDVDGKRKADVDIWVRSYKKKALAD